MSGSTDPFLVLVDDIGALRRQIENLQRTSLDRDEAEHLNATIAQSLDNMAQTGKRLEQRLEGQLQLATAKTHRDAIEAAQGAARAAIRESHAEILQTAKSLSQAAGRPAERRGVGSAGSGSGWPRSGPQGRLSARWPCSGSKAVPMPKPSDSIPASTAPPQAGHSPISGMEADTASSWFRHRHSQPGNDGSRAGLDRDFQPKRLGDLHHRGQRRVPIPG